MEGWREATGWFIGGGGAVKSTREKGRKGVKNEKTDCVFVWVDIINIVSIR